MGGRGASSGSPGSGGRLGGSISLGGGGASVANQAPSPQNTPVVPNATTVLSQMTDQQLTALYNASRNVDMPNHLSDVSDATQKFVFAVGLNEKPTVLSDSAFNQYMIDNGIPKSQILARSVGLADYTVNGTHIVLTPQQVTDLTKYGELNYVGGKHGGMVYGAGTYFAMNGGRPTGYANGQTIIGVLSPTAKAISKSALIAQTARWSQSHPQFANAVGTFTSRNASIYALAQGYNIITDGASYYNVIDRSAVVLRQSNY